MGLAATTNMPYIIHLIADELIMRTEKGAFIDRLICAQSDKHVIGKRGEG